ncbi:MAG: HEAT repeat domain-containing protein, partial [archaeon]
LSVTGVPRDLKLIGAKLYDESPMVRVGAAHTLGGIRGREKILAHNLLSDRLMDSGADLEIRNACIQGLSIIYDRPTFALYMGNYEDQALFDKSRKLVRAIKPKTGTSTVLLGGDLYEKVIIRGGRLFFNGKPYGVGLPKSSVEAWKEAYEFNWKSVGLDYNPIEPILKDKKGNYLIKKNKDGTFRVYAGVLPAFTHFAFTRKEGTKKYVGDVKRNGKIVLDTLDSMMWHGHMHPFNLLVGVKEGKARVYAIDFDRAKLKKFLPAKN